MEMFAQRRVVWIDIARGIAIIFMVMGHSSIPQPLSKYIWSFHMPLFFIVSGYFFNSKKFLAFKDFLYKKLRTLIIPYCFFTILVFIGYIGTEYFKPYELYYGWKGYALWFVPVLFFTEITFFFLSKLKISYLIIATIIIVAFGKYLSNLNIHLPFKIECVPFALFFVSSGYILKNFWDTKPLRWYWLILAGAVTIVLSQILPKIGIGRNEFGNIIPNLFNALLGCYFIFNVSKYLSKLISYLPVRIIDYFGRNSIYVMAFSQVFNYWILTCLNHVNLPNYILLPCRYIILFTAIYFAGEFLTRNVPFLVGRLKTKLK